MGALPSFFLLYQGPPPAMQRGTTGPQFIQQQSGPSMSPVQHSSYQQGGHSYGQYGPPGMTVLRRWRFLVPVSVLRLVCPPSGNFSRPPHYGGTPSANYSGPGPGPGLTNSLGLNASGPMHGQGPSTPGGRGPGPGAGGRPYPAGAATMAPTSPSMPQPAGQGMGPPGPNATCKPPEMGPNDGLSANSSSLSSTGPQSR